MCARRNGRARASGPSGWRVVVVLVAAAGLAGPILRAGAGGSSPLQRALDFLDRQQLRRPLDVVDGGVRIRDYPGNWPQSFTLRGAERLRRRDVSPFTVAFIHHALTLLSGDHRRPLGLTGTDLLRARRMRVRAVDFVRRFEAGAGAPDTGTFGFWPYDDDPAVPGPGLEAVLMGWLKGPVLGGTRVPLNLAVHPAPLAIPTDADVTATTYAVLLDDATLDGGAGTTRDVSRFFTDWRDVGAVPRRLNPSWLPPQSGAFLTWLAYREPGAAVYPNDVDLVVNANVLFALGRYGRADAAGAAEAAGLIDAVTADGLHRTAFETLAEYYPDNLVFQYAVSRAYAEGPMPGLAPAVSRLADDLEAAAVRDHDGTVHWDRGDSALNTAFAVLTLVNAGRHGRLVDGGIRYLASAQHPDDGFPEATFFFGRADGGQVFEFRSAAFTTAMVLEAFARDALLHERPEP